MKFFCLWYMWAFATALCLALLVSSKCGERHLRQRLHEVERAQRNMIEARFVPKDTPVGPVDRIALSSICMEIFNACTNSHYAVFDAYVDDLRQVCGGAALSDKADWARIESVLRHCAHEGFLFPAHPFRFESAGEFAKFIQVNVDLCYLCGSLHVRRNEFEKAQFIESLVLSRLYQLKADYPNRSDDGYSRIVDKYVAQWLEHIESADGFSRAFAEYSFRLNTEYANALRPGKGLPREKALQCARAAAIGLIKSGYRPKWLGDYKGESAERDPWEK